MTNYLFSTNAVWATNILVTVVAALTTNVTERWPTHPVGDPCPDRILGCIVYHSHQEPDKDPQKKRVRTTVQWYTNTAFETWTGLPPISAPGPVVSDIEVEHRLKRVETWEASGTNDLKRAEEDRVERWKGAVMTNNPKRVR